MNQYLKGLLSTFKERYEIVHLSDSEAFERLVNYTMASQYHAYDFNLDDASPGGAGDIGIDGLVILVNNRVVTSEDEFRGALEMMGEVEVNFLLSQAKTSAHFKAAEVGTFLSGVESFFAQHAELPENSDISNLRVIKDLIYQNAAALRGRPGLALYYAAAGTWNEDKVVLSRAEQHLDRLRDTHLFSDVRFIPMDQERLFAAYNLARHYTTATVTFSTHVTMPELEGVVQAFVGLIPVEEYLKLIADNEGRVVRRVFSDNVRDFLGVNRVNSEIHNTLADKSVQPLLPLLNNGVTIVTRSLHRTGSRFTLKNYQIVNGCQTSWVLWANSDSILPTTLIPIRLVETTDAELTNSIIRATNSQTEVMVEAFESLKPFHKRLEGFYESQLQVSPMSLRYERRSMQYSWDAEVRPQDVVTLASQLCAYLAVWIEQPHSTRRYYGELLRSYSKRLFREEHDPLEYYVAAIAMRHADRWFRSGRGNPALRPMRAHMAMALRALTAPVTPRPTGKVRQRYLRAVHELLTSDKVNTYLARAERCIEAAVRSSPGYSCHQLATRKEFTQSLLQLVSAEVGGNVSVSDPSAHVDAPSKSHRRRRARRRRGGKRG